MVVDRGNVLGQAAATPPAPTTPQEYSRLVLNPAPNRVRRSADAGREEG
jgi:hypothetical protein